MDIEDKMGVSDVKQNVCKNPSPGEPMASETGTGPKAVSYTHLVYFPLQCRGIGGRQAPGYFPGSLSVPGSFLFAYLLFRQFPKMLPVSVCVPHSCVYFPHDV